MNKQNLPVVKAEMLIRKPVHEVFEAMINPEITSKFWFTKSSGRVEPGKTLEWEWGQFGVSDTVDILEVRTNEYISLEWKPGDLKTKVEMEFEPHSETSTLFKVTESGFWDSAPAEDEKLEEKINLMLGQNGGWNLVLCNMKAWLEHKLDLNLIADHNPKAAVK
ncbi:MAG: SRPBCC domain-containing protein [Gracilimonas sp.]|uniref:SRPBCC family protein n=1 Tax=Gracilimonas sp. TaxID=1974203 RepID=UPI00198B23F8|nr:SRPBCC family protein [Gracilimonas sp.]MBD3616212.1 SRPBCC domain-containing protein [Gracilimonas sp.]